MLGSSSIAGIEGTALLVLISAARLPRSDKLTLFSGHTAMNKKNPKVDGVLRREKKWREEFEALRTIALDSELAEELKWYQACYTLHGKNVILIHGFKEFCALMFFKGALLKDQHRLLVTPGQHQSARQIRFASVREIMKMEPIVKAYSRSHCSGKSRLESEA